MKRTSEELIDEILESPKVLKYVKITGSIIGCLIAVYALGHIFKIGAHAVRGYNDFRNSLNGN